MLKKNSLPSLKVLIIYHQCSGPMTDVVLVKGFHNNYQALTN